MQNTLERLDLPVQVVMSWRRKHNDSHTNTDIPVWIYPRGSIFSTMGNRRSLRNKWRIQFGLIFRNFLQSGGNAQIVSGEVLNNPTQGHGLLIDCAFWYWGCTFTRSKFANGNGGTSGDSWGTDSWIVSELTTSNPSPSYHSTNLAAETQCTHSVFELNSGSPTTS